jgi:hypothetical protein
LFVYSNIVSSANHCGPCAAAVVVVVVAVFEIFVAVFVELVAVFVVVVRHRWNHGMFVEMIFCDTEVGAWGDVEFSFADQCLD